MKMVLKALALLPIALVLASCSQTAALRTTMSEQSPVQSVEKTSSVAPSPMQLNTAKATAAPIVTPTPDPLPLPTGVTEELIKNLPDPSLWAASLHIDPKDYPRIDGSTATIPLGIYLRSKITGESLKQSLAATVFTKTGPAWLAIASRQADLLVVYEAPDEIKKQFDSSKLIVKPAGLDALVFLTNKGNPVTNLTQKQIMDIYTGKVRKWSQVGGQNTQIIPYQRISNSGSQALMLKLVMRNVHIMDAPIVEKPSEMGELIDDIASYANTSNALGYSVYYYVRNMYKVPGIKLLSVNGIEPSARTIALGQYPYINPFYAVIREDEPAGSPTHKLFDWLTSTEGKKAVQDAGYVPPQS